ncbi:hypothetical protein H2204_013263 [Knufia peltigerae]|uniref:LSM complex subunit LSM4 n=1 Tax=Knufia peltigerae TaxID=1002370 RepID=A0AA38XRP6_9EURO|nr:hypothetical protein H2204_013263 [Knufia peltigerae]
MLPLGLLTAAQGHPMLVELKNGETLNGHLVNCDTWMNLTLKEVVQTSPEGDRSNIYGSPKKSSISPGNSSSSNNNNIATTPVTMVNEVVAVAPTIVAATKGAEEIEETEEIEDVVAVEVEEGLAKSYCHYHPKATFNFLAPPPQHMPSSPSTTRNYLTYAQHVRPSTTFAPVDNTTSTPIPSRALVGPPASISSSS